MNTSSYLTLARSATRLSSHWALVSGILETTAGCGMVSLLVSELRDVADIVASAFQCRHYLEKSDVRLGPNR